MGVRDDEYDYLFKGTLHIQNISFVAYLLMIFSAKTSEQWFLKK